MLGPLLALRPHSAERAAAIAKLAAQDNLTDWTGRPITLTERTIHRRLKQYDDQGAIAFAPRARADKGRAKVIISLKAEQAIPFDSETWEEMAGNLRAYIRGHWKAGATLKKIEGRANIRFRELVAEAGFDHAHALPADTLDVPRRFIVAERQFRNVAILHKDRKRYEDSRFRTQRSRAQLMPMDWVIGDVHPVDIVSMRDDGTTAHARMIAWLDGATNRLRFDLVLCEAGTGIRNADLVQSFCRMLADPTWGMPKTLYIDNGREYRFADDVNDALALVAQLRGDDGRTMRAMPYNAAAKPIEGIFAGVERMLQDTPGHTGGDRMNKKTEHSGRPPKAFPGSLEPLATIIHANITETEIYRMRGVLNGRSPRQVYEAAIAAGWQPVAVDPRQILTVFATDRECKISKGVITFDNRKWTCDELAAYFEDKVIARVPRFWPPAALPLLHVKTRELIGVAEPVPVFAFDDPAGARLSKRQDKLRRDAIRDLDRSTPTIDTVREGLRIAAMAPPPSVAAPVAKLSVSDEAAEITKNLAVSAEDREASRYAKALKKSRETVASIERFDAAIKKAHQQ